jgi:hypothetical protein
VAIGNLDLTDVSKEQAQTEPGMAHFAGTGPKGKTCGHCIFWGYKKVSGTKFNEETGETYETLRAYEGCKKYHQIANRHGPAIPAASLSCKYFEDKPSEQSTPLQRPAPTRNKSFDPRPRNQRFRV